VEGRQPGQGHRSRQGHPRRGVHDRPVRGARRGKLVRLARLVYRHYPALEADFKRWYDLDLGGIWTGEIPLRKAANLAEWLPLGAAVYVSEGSDDAWTAAEHIAVSIQHQLAIANWQRAGSKGSAPDPLPRPSEEAEKISRAERQIAKAKAFAARQKARAAAGRQE